MTFALHLGLRLTKLLRRRKAPQESVIQIPIRFHVVMGWRVQLHDGKRTETFPETSKSMYLYEGRTN